MESQTKLFQWKLPHPVLISSGPLATSAKPIISAFGHGAAVVVTKTISTENYRTIERIKHCSDNVLFNSDGFSTLSVSQWIDNWKALKGYPIIANIHASQPERLADLAVKIVDAGAEVLELGLSCPTSNDDPICFDLKRLYRYCLCVRKEVTVPVTVKIIVNMSRQHNRDTIRCLEDTGMDGITLSDSLPAFLGRTGGLTGPFLKPLVSRTLLDIENSPLYKIAVGGVFSKQDVQDYIQCGANAVGVCTMVIKKGWNEFERLVNDVREEV